MTAETRKYCAEAFQCEYKTQHIGEMEAQLASAIERAERAEARIGVVWLIEWPEDDNNPVRWWHPITGWMRDANKALWFARKEDAAAFKKSQLLHGTVTEHKFVDHAALTQKGGSE